MAARPRQVSAWLFAVAALIFAMVVVGGITRLTESGLSIVRWDPISGALPPLNDSQWQDAFALYKSSPQYQLVNRGMSLVEFRHIFFWEYVHRLLGRLIGLAFALPLLWFWLKKRIPRGYGPRLVAILALGGLQGAIGWSMVYSGLQDRPEVSHIRLAIHLLTALLLFSLTLWTALDLVRLARDPELPRAAMPTIAIWTLSLLGLQLMFGAYVAGLDAGFAFNSWPKMGEEWFPSGAPMMKPALRNLVDNPIVVQFVHRWLAFAVAAMALLFALAVRRAGLKARAAAVAGAVVLQIALGISTLLSGVAIEIAVAHQAMAVLLLTSILVAAHGLGSVGRA
jgi:cytochrome c oxidase assembly protein subunit 15